MYIIYFHTFIYVHLLVLVNCAIQVYGSFKIRSNVWRMFMSKQHRFSQINPWALRPVAHLYIKRCTPDVFIELKLVKVSL